METVFLGNRVVDDVDAFLQARRRLDQDRHDEVWEGVYHVAPDPHPDHGIVQAELLFVLGPPCQATRFAGQRRLQHRTRLS